MHFTKCNSATIGTYNLHSKLYNKTRPLSCSTQCHLNYHCNVTIVRLNAVENNTMSAPYKTSLKKFLFVCSNTKSATCCPGVNELNLHGIIRWAKAYWSRIHPNWVDNWMAFRDTSRNASKINFFQVCTSIQILPYKDPSCLVPASTLIYCMNCFFTRNTMSHISVPCTKVCRSYGTMFTDGQIINRNHEATQMQCAANYMVYMQWWIWKKVSICSKVI